MSFQGFAHQRSSVDRAATAEGRSSSLGRTLQLVAGWNLENGRMGLLLGGRLAVRGPLAGRTRDLGKDRRFQLHAGPYLGYGRLWRLWDFWRFRRLWWLRRLGHLRLGKLGIRHFGCLRHVWQLRHLGQFRHLWFLERRWRRKRVPLSLHFMSFDHAFAEILHLQGRSVR